MADEGSDGRVGRTLKHAAGMASAAGAYKGLQLTWKLVTGKEAPLGPDDQQAPLGRAESLPSMLVIRVRLACPLQRLFTAYLPPVWGWPRLPGCAGANTCNALPAPLGRAAGDA